VRPGNYALGSAHLRAAVRSLLETREASKENESGVPVVYREDESVAEIRRLADALRTGRMRVQSGNAHLRSIQTWAGKKIVAGRADCLSERIRRAQEGLRRAQGLEAGTHSGRRCKFEFYR
jgi:hypothetical protein